MRTITSRCNAASPLSRGSAPTRAASATSLADAAVAHANRRMPGASSLPMDSPPAATTWRAATTCGARHNTKDREGDWPSLRRLLFPAGGARRDEGERDREQRKAGCGPLPQAAIGSLEGGAERERGAERGFLGDDHVAGWNTGELITHGPQRRRQRSADNHRPDCVPEFCGFERLSRTSDGGIQEQGGGQGSDGQRHALPQASD